MRPTEELRRQHAELIQLSDRLCRLAPGVEVTPGMQALRVALSELSARLDEHLTIEDEVLYPALMARPSPVVRDTARRFFRELGGLRVAYLEYLDRWCDDDAIRAERDAFVSDTHAIVSRLLERIHREDRELLILVESRSSILP